MVANFEENPNSSVPFAPPSLCSLKGSAMPDKFYSKDHEWVEIGQDGLATVGITAHAPAALGDIVSVRLPDPGRSVAKGEACALVKTAASESEIAAPLTGTIAETNATITEDPSLVNKDPEAAWFFKMRLADPTAFTELMDKAAYDAFLGTL
jgi:glycine cleavage system H protein